MLNMCGCACVRGYSCARRAQRTLYACGARRTQNVHRKHTRRCSLNESTTTCLRLSMADAYSGHV